jgi:hypothetical protein
MILVLQGYIFNTFAPTLKNGGIAQLDRAPAF